MTNIVEGLQDLMTTLGYDAHLAEAIMEMMNNPAFPNQHNEVVYHYLGSVGYEGQYSDRWSAWARDGFPVTSPETGLTIEDVAVWYDPSDLTTMFQDEAGTVPVTAHGQTVRKLLDKSGNDQHLIGNATFQEVAGVRTLFFDGSTNYFTGTADLGSSGNCSMIMAVDMRESDSNDWPLNFNGTGTNSFRFFNSAARVALRLRNSLGSNITFYGPETTEPFDMVSVIIDGDNEDVTFLYEGETTQTNTSAGTTTFGEAVLDLGRRSNGGNIFNGHLYGLVITSGIISDTNREEVEAFLLDNAS